MDVRELTAETERRAAVPVLRQLWSESTPDQVLAWTGEDDYHLLGGFVADELVAVAGVLESNHLHHARQAWLYDLVVDEPHRGQGYGTALLDHVEAWAREAGCASVALATPLAKERTHEFYEAVDYEKWGYVLEKQLE